MIAEFLRLDARQWLALTVAVLTLLVLVDACIGHYRSGFPVRAQYAPFVSGAALVVAAIMVAIAPDTAWVRTTLLAAGWTAVVAGVIGFGFHHYYGIVAKPGGYGWLLHHVLYAAPPLAPLALSSVGALGVVTARGLPASGAAAGAAPPTALLTLVAVTLLGASIQAAILHYRGAFNNALMYAPLTAPLLAAAACAWYAVTPGGTWLLPVLVGLLWLTFFTGFVGLGMHLRGFDRVMGGLYLPRENVMNGPALAAPALFSGFALVGLIAVVMRSP